MKRWEDMTARERAEKTYNDIQRRKEARKIGEREADGFMFSNIFKAKKERDKIRHKSYRGK